MAIFRLICLMLCCARMAIAADPGQLCRDAAIRAATDFGIPPNVLLAITLTETGRTMAGQLQPWPWTTNTAGTGAWHATEAEVISAINAMTEQGIRNFDVGCFQLNHRWHANAFASAADMVDPARNAAYAAKYLVEKFATTQDWGKAAAAYHSGTPAYATRYQARFDAILASLPAGSIPDSPTIARADQGQGENAFPLLRVGQRGAGASLVPLGRAARPLFGQGG